LWDIENGKELAQIVGHTKAVRQVCFAADGKRVLSSSDDDTVRLWNLDNGQEIRRFAFNHNAFTVAVSADGTRVLTGGYDKQVILWDLETGKLLWSRPTSNGIDQCTFSSDGKLAASCGSEKTIRIWNTENGRLVKQLRGHSSNVLTVAFSPNGRYLLSA